MCYFSIKWVDLEEIGKPIKLSAFKEWFICLPTPGLVCFPKYMRESREKYFKLFDMDILAIEANFYDLRLNLKMKDDDERQKFYAWSKDFIKNNIDQTSEVEKEVIRPEHWIN